MGLRPPLDFATGVPGSALADCSAFSCMLYAPTRSFTPDAPIAEVPVREIPPRTTDKISSLAILFRRSKSGVMSELIYDRTINDLETSRYAIDKIGRAHV